jgi:hypothetical protein
VPKFDDFQDYLYVSSRKALRMGRTLRPEAWKRIKELGLNVGPVGAKITLDDLGPADAIALLPELWRALDEKYGIKDLNDPDLQVGHWFLAEAVDMAYGQTYEGPVLFLGRQGQTNLILGGSGEHLLDRRVVERNALNAQSTLFELMGTLRGMHKEILQQMEEDLEYAAQPANTGGAGYLHSPGEFNLLMYFLAGGHDPYFLERGHDPSTVGPMRLVADAGSAEIPGLEPLTAVARVLDMEDRDHDLPPIDSNRVVLGTPLYVAFHVPR